MPSESKAAPTRRASTARRRAGHGDAPLRAVTPVSSGLAGGLGDGLTARQRRILDFIRGWVAQHGYPPSVREIGEAVDLVSPSSVAYQLKELEKKGQLRRDPNRPRAVDVRTPSDVTADDDEALRGRASDTGLRAAGRPDRRRWADPGRAVDRRRLPAPPRAGR